MQVYAAEVIDTDGAGIANANGVLERVQLTRNTNDPDALGFIGAGSGGALANYPRDPRECAV